MKRNSPLTLILAAVALLLVTQSAEAGKLRRLLFDNYNYAGQWITNLYAPNVNSNGVAAWPTMPDNWDYMPPHQPGSEVSPFLAITSTNRASTTPVDGYGSLIEGYLTAPETGNYIFWLSSDDEGQFWMNTDSSDPLNPSKTNLICRIAGSTGNRVWNVAAQTNQQSANIALVKGVTYYLQILHKEGGGNDHIQLGWQTPSGLLERPMPCWHFQPIRDDGREFLTVDAVAGPVTPWVLNGEPNGSDVNDGNWAVVYANVNLDPPVTYQWVHPAGTNVLGATNAYYLFRANQADGGTWTVRVNGGAYSADAFLQVYGVEPLVLSAGIAPRNPTKVQVTFSEDVNPSTIIPANFTLTGGAIVSAVTLEPDNRTVTLTTGLLFPTNIYLLTVKDIADVAQPPFAMTAPYTTNFLIADGAITFRYSDFRVDTVDRLREWSDPNSTAPSYVNNWFSEERTITNNSYQYNLAPVRDNFCAQMIGYVTPTETGNYKFAITSDDQGLLYLGTTDQRSSKREICRATGSTGRWNLGNQVANQQSALIWLEAGKRYFIEAVHRDATGGDGISIFWQTPSGPALPTANADVQATAQPFLIPMARHSTFASTPVVGSLTYRIWDALPTDLATLRTWSTNTSTAVTYTRSLYKGERVITTPNYQWNLDQPMWDLFQGQIIGYVTAPETGNYRFGILADDNGIIYMCTNAAAQLPSDKREICNVDAPSTRWNLNFRASQISRDIYLEAGRRYYIEAVLREGTGGDGLNLTWFTPSLAPWPAAATLTNQAAVEPYIIPGQYLSVYSAFGNVVLKTNLPATFSAAESSQPVLSVVPDGTTPYFYQWLKNGTPIPGATNRTYTLPYVTAADATPYQVIVSNLFSSVTSVPAALTVTADTSKPAVVSVGSVFKRTIELRLTEPVTSATATATGNYLLLSSAGAPVAVTSAVQDPADAAHITLQTTVELPETDLMTLVVQNLADAAANVINPATNAFRANNFDTLANINTVQAYSATADGDTLYMTAGGADIWGNADQGAYLYKTVTGNFDYKVQGIGLETIDQWCKMGIMARPSTAPGARNAFTAFTPRTPSQNTYTSQIRELLNGTSTSTDFGSVLSNGLQTAVSPRPTVVYPSWLRLQRINNIFYWYYGTTGTDWRLWTYYDSALTAEGALPSTMQLGLALTSHDTAATANGVMRSFTAVDDGPLRFAVQHTNITVVESQPVSFTVVAAGRSPYYYQWLTNNTPVPGATNATLSFTRLSYCTDNGLLVTCRLTNGYNEQTNATATVTVIRDAAPPTVAFGGFPKITRIPTKVRMLFSERVDPGTAQTAANYKIYRISDNAELPVLSATLQPDGRSVELTTDDQTQGTTYRVVVNNVTDLACQPPNPVAANSTDYFFHAGSAGGPPSIAWLSFHAADNAPQASAAGAGFTEAPDVGYTRLLANAGYQVTRFVSAADIHNNNAANVALTNSLSTNGLIIQSRSLDSGHFDTANEVNAWNSMPVPMMLLDGYNNRANRQGLHTGDTIPDINSNPVRLQVNNPFHPIFAGIPLDANNLMVNPYASIVTFNGVTHRGISVVTSAPVAGGTNLARVGTTGDAAINGLVIGEFPAGTASSRTNTFAGPRLVFLTGSREANGVASQTAGMYDLLSDGEKLFLNAVSYMFPVAIAPPGPPSITLTSPTNGAAFPGNPTISLECTVTGPTPIVSVDYYHGGTNFIGRATTAPWAIDWDSVPDGVYSLSARATDGLGYQAASAPAQIAVGDTTKPVVYAVGSLGGTGIGVYFLPDNTGLNTASALNPANYVVNGGASTVTNATLEPEGTIVLLSIDPPISGAFSVQITNVYDLGYNTVDPTTLSSTVLDWMFNQDVGTNNGSIPLPLLTDPLMPGLAQAIGTNGFYVRAGGSDIYGNSDGMHFVYLPVTNAFDAVVRVESMTRPNEWSKAGIMVREDLGGTNRNFMIAATPTNGVNQITVQWRLTNSLATAAIANRPPSPLPNAWLRLTRKDQDFSFFWSTNGADWMFLYSSTNLAYAPYPDTVYVGLATTSHNNTTGVANMVRVYYRDLTVQPLVESAEKSKLSIQLLSPTQVAISWTSTDAALKLQFSDAIGPVNWQDVTEPAVKNGDTYTVTVTFGTQPRFYRLLKP